MLKIIYYSRGTLIPALFCAEKHCRPASTPEQTLRRVQQWLADHGGDVGSAALLPYGNGGEGVSLYVMTASAPPGLVERTLSNLFRLLGRGDADPFILVSSLPLSRSGSAARQTGLVLSPKKLRALWPEIEAAVQQARLQIALLEKLNS